MSPRVKDLSRRIFGRLTVIVYAYRTAHGEYYYHCLCACGTRLVVRGSHLRSGDTRSCGCLQRDLRTTHGLGKPPEYAVWASMLQRCTNPKEIAYPNYGGRGIRVCRRWYRFANFYADMGSRPTPKHTIERINNDGNYCPSNCKWATRSEQNKNRRKFNRKGTAHVGS